MSPLLFLQTAEREQENSPLTYIIPTERMIESEYPIPSYIADVFEKPVGWVESPNAPGDATPKIYALDCEMVCIRIFWKLNSR